MTLLLPNSVSDVFADVIIDNSVDLIRKYPEFEKFLDYILDTWVEGALFPTPLWNHWEHMETRTNNNNEAYNQRIEKKVGSQATP